MAEPSKFPLLSILSLQLQNFPDSIDRSENPVAVNRLTLLDQVMASLGGYFGSICLQADRAVQ
ncbi:hypothetical protein ACN4EG_07955 [Alkalinema pantanalense CENA528]|uniref:hypothetical protein n=1 Tax=Alkalinema pantanalense TaxID=1620705 RepID=UPI003D6F7394